MFKASVNTNCTYDSTGQIQACESKNGNKGICIFSISITYTCAVSNLMFNSGECCDSTADHNQAKEM